MRLSNMIETAIYGGICLTAYLIPESIQLNYPTLAWYRGHMIDFAIPAAYVGLGLANFKNKLLRVASVVTPPTLCILHELQIVNLDPKAMTYDPQDIYCALAGATFAFSLSKIYDTEIYNNLTRKILKKFGIESTLKDTLITKSLC